MEKTLRLNQDQCHPSLANFQQAACEGAMLLAEELKPSTQTTQGAQDREEEWSYVEKVCFFLRIFKRYPEEAR